MSDFVKQNAKILKSLNVNIERLSESTIEWFLSSRTIPTGRIWTRGEQPEPAEFYDRIVQLMHIDKKENPEGNVLLFTPSDNCPQSTRVLQFKDLLPHEKLYVSIVLINKYLK